MVNGIIGKKVGMTQLFLEDGTVAPATVLQAGPCIVVQPKTAQIDGYEAVQIGLVEKSRCARTRRALAISRRPTCRRPASARGKHQKGAEAPKAGDQVLCSIFNQGERVDVIGTSKGKGFQGTVKRHHFAGGDKSHGSMFHRAPGSIGASSYPSRVFPGMRMHGHMGDERITVRNLKVLQGDAENNVIVVRGNVPAPTAATC